MLNRPVRLPPEHVYPTDEWRVSRRAPFVNGFHKTWPIVHAEQAYGSRARARRS